MKKIKPEILFFGIAREIAGERAVIEVEENITAGELQEFLKNKYPRLKDISSVLIAVNQAYVSPDTVLRQTDEIAVIPPVSGG